MSRSLVHRFTRDGEEAQRKAKGNLGQAAHAGDGHGREETSGAQSWAILLWITLLSFG